MRSRSSAKKPLLPLELDKPAPGAQQEDRLAELVAVSMAPAAWGALDAVLRAEQAHHLREAAFCSDAEQRLEHRGVYRWLEEFLSGITMAKYAEQAKERLRAAEPTEGEPLGGSEWMESDGLEP